MHPGELPQISKDTYHCLDRGMCGRTEDGGKRGERDRERESICAYREKGDKERVEKKGERMRRQLVVRQNGEVEQKTDSSFCLPVHLLLPLSLSLLLSPTLMHGRTHNTNVNTLLLNSSSVLVLVSWFCCLS